MDLPEKNSGSINFGFGTQLWSSFYPPNHVRTSTLEACSIMTDAPALRDINLLSSHQHHAVEKAVTVWSTSPLLRSLGCWARNPHGKCNPGVCATWPPRLAPTITRKQNPPCLARIRASKPRLRQLWWRRAAGHAAFGLFRAIRLITS